MRTMVFLPLVALAFTAVQGLPQIGRIQFNRVPVSNERSYDISGSYYQDNSGAYNDGSGQYVADNSGAYQADNSGAYEGRYVHDNSGAYVHDNSGDYVGDYNPYVHQDNGFRSGNENLGGSGGYGGGSGISGGAGFGTGISKPISSGLGIGSISKPPTSLPVKPPTFPPVKPPTPIVPQYPVSKPSIPSAVSSGAGSLGIGTGSGISPASGYGKPVALKQGNAAGFYDNRNYKIIRKIEQVEQDGYHYLYETENGIFGEEEGHVANKNSDNEVMKAKGFFSYTGPDAIVYTVRYTADENGFVPQGAHLPTPPPIPEAIVRSLEYQKSLGEL